MREKVADDARDALGALARVAHRAEQLVELLLLLLARRGRRVAQERRDLVAEVVDVRDDVGERVVQLVRDARCERAYGGEPLRLLELRLRAPRRAHVAHQDDAHVLVAELHRADRHVDAQHAAVGATP
jgi:hypothetical protein